jgi:CBS domain-containing protein
VTLRYLALANLALGIFNLLPGFPLDGGRVLRALWWMRTGSPLRATRAASRAGRMVAAVLMALGAMQLLFGGGIQGLWLILIGLFLRAAAVSAYRDLEIRTLLEGVRVADVLEALPPAIPAGTSVAVALRDYFERYGADAFPVAGDGRIRGVVELGRIREIPEGRQGALFVEEIQVPLSELPMVSWGGLLSRALSVMAATGRRGVVAVSEDGQPVGRVTREGVERFLRNRRELALRRGGSGS